MSLLNLIRTAVAVVFLALAAPACVRAANVYTSPRPAHLEYEFNYRGAKTKFVSDLWLVIDKNRDGSYTVKLTGWGYVRQVNVGKKVWENKHWTPASTTARAKDGMLSLTDEAGFNGLKLKTVTTVNLKARKASHQIYLLVGGGSIKLASGTVDLPR